MHNFCNCEGDKETIRRKKNALFSLLEELNQKSRVVEKRCINAGNFGSIFFYSQFIGWMEL